MYIIELRNKVCEGNLADLLKCQVGRVHQPPANLCFTAGCHTAVIIQPSELYWSIGEAFAHSLTCSSAVCQFIVSYTWISTRLPCFLSLGISKKPLYFNGVLQCLLVNSFLSCMTEQVSQWRHPDFLPNLAVSINLPLKIFRKILVANNYLGLLPCSISTTEYNNMGLLKTPWDHH